MRLLLLLLLLMTSPSWAYLTAGKLAVTATSSSSGVPSTSQDSDIGDVVGTSVSVGVPVAVTGNMNITGTYQVNGTPISSTSNWSQVGNTINYTAGNVGIGSVTPGQKLDVSGTVRSTAFVQTGSNLNNFVGNVAIGTAVAGNQLVVLGAVQAGSFTGQNGEGIGLSQTSTTMNTPFHALTDLHVTAYSECGGGNATLSCYTDSSTTPGTLAGAGNTGSGNYLSCAYYVLKGNYYLNTTSCSGGSAVIGGIQTTIGS